MGDADEFGHLQTMSTYSIAEIFYSLQGEGARAGMPCVFVRFAGCNLHCTVDSVGFDCDTDHGERHMLNAEQLVELIDAVDVGCCRRVVFTGGEPLLQLDVILASRLRERGYSMAIETNGTVPLDGDLQDLLDFVACSPKRGHDVVIPHVHEVKVVIAAGESPPIDQALTADRWYLTPAAEGGVVPVANLQWCIKQCLASPRWSLSAQQHKAWGIR